MGNNCLYNFHVFFGSQICELSRTSPHKYSIYLAIDEIIYKAPHRLQIDLIIAIKGSYIHHEGAFQFRHEFFQ